MSQIIEEIHAAKWPDTSWTVAFCAQFKHLTTIIWDYDTPALRSLRPPTSALWRTVCHLSSLFFFFLCFSATVEINCYLWLSRPQLLKYWRTKQDWLSEVERLGQSRLIRQTKCYFCFLCGCGERGLGGSLITSAISVVPANTPITALFSLGLIQAGLLDFLSKHNTYVHNSPIWVCVHVWVQVWSGQKPIFLNIWHVNTQPKGWYWGTYKTLTLENCHKWTVLYVLLLYTRHDIPNSSHTNCHWLTAYKNIYWCIQAFQKAFVDRCSSYYSP